MRAFDRAHVTQEVSDVQAKIIDLYDKLTGVAQKDRSSIGVEFSRKELEA